MGPTEEIRNSLHFNTFYYQPEFDSGPTFLNDAMPVADEYYISVEVEETPDYAEEPEEGENENNTSGDETDENENDEWSESDACADAYPKYVDGQLQKCPRDISTYKPLCGSDDKTYYNECVFQSEKCFGIGKDDLTISYEGICEGDPLKEWEIELESPVEES